MSDSENSNRERSKPPETDYDRFGFKNNFKEADTVHWSRPWMQPNGAPDEATKPANTV